MAEGEGFEPPDLSVNGFQDRRLKPLGHPSTWECYPSAGDSVKDRRLTRRRLDGLGTEFPLLVIRSFSEIRSLS